MIKINNITKSFGSLCAVDNINLHVNNGIFGLLGPNGAGKTTIVRILVTLLRPTQGTAVICGFDITKEQKKVREVISYVPQEMALDIKLTGKENVLLYAKLYGIPDRTKKVNDVLELMELTDRCDDLVRTYSGGMRRRLELAQALVHEPKVLFLDEPTLGLDVSARKKIWKHISSLQQSGIAIFMTTHYMEEADEYCDTVAIIDHGRIVALDTPEKLKNSLKKDVITIHASGTFTGLDFDGVLYAGEDNGELNFLVDNGEEGLPLLSRALLQQGMTIHSMTITKPTLNDVFMDRVTTREDDTAFDGYKFRTMLRRRS
jgi:ABC-2 type transport system ATP-binding protein